MFEVLFCLEFPHVCCLELITFSKVKKSRVEWCGGICLLTRAKVWCLKNLFDLAITLLRGCET